MRRFHSYGPVDTDENYYVPREDLIEKTYTQLTGYNPKKGGHYFTVWAPRQTGKTWIMQRVLFGLQKDPRFHVVKINLEILKNEENVSNVLDFIAEKIGDGLGKNFTGVKTPEQFHEIFKKSNLDKPLILILDEFDAISEKGINTVVSVFRNIYIHRSDEIDLPTEQTTYLLHSAALIGVRSVLGTENQEGAPFNVQRSVHIPNLTYEEVEGMFKWYEKESGQKVQPEVIEELYRETNGQPGLTCWFGELLSEGFTEYTNDKTKPITLENFEEVMNAATSVLPNNNILNIISKANDEEYKEVVLELFQTDRKVDFSYDDKALNYLYMNGVIDREKEKEGPRKGKYYVKFASPFVQKRLFNYFSREYFSYMGKLYAPFDKAYDDIIDGTHLDIANLLRYYETYLAKNRDWLLKDAPRRSDTKIFEAVYHFNLYSYLKQFMAVEDGNVYPEFPTGNGKIDLFITYSGKQYGLEVKSYTTRGNYRHALEQAARYGKQLGLEEIFLAFFIEFIDGDNREKYEREYLDEATGIKVTPVFIATGEKAGTL